MLKANVDRSSWMELAGTDDDTATSNTTKSDDCLLVSGVVFIKLWGRVAPSVTKQRQQQWQHTISASIFMNQSTTSTSTEWERGKKIKCFISVLFSSLSSSRCLTLSVHTSHSKQLLFLQLKSETFDIFIITIFCCCSSASSHVRPSWDYLYACSGFLLKRRRISALNSIVRLRFCGIWCQRKRRIF